MCSPESGKWKSAMSVETLLAMPGVMAGERDEVSVLYAQNAKFMRRVSHAERREVTPGDSSNGCGFNLHLKRLARC